MNLNYDPENPFNTSYFFQEFNKKIPQKVKSNNVPKPHEIDQFRRDIEENERIYFLGWRDNKIRNQDVSPENLMKTKLLLGMKAYERCK